MRFRNPTVAVLALAVPCTWVLARQSVTPPTPPTAAPTESEPEPEQRVQLAPAPRPLASPPPARPPLELQSDPTRLELAAGEYEVGALVGRWAAALDLAVTVDPQLRSIRLGLEAPRVLDRPALRALLDVHDVVLVRRGAVLHAVHRRNLAPGFGPPWTLAEDAPVDPDALVTRIVQIQHGAGNAIFAVVRGLLTRDSNRLGNILYVQGPEQILLCDFARNVRYYEQVIAAFDQPVVAGTPAGVRD